MHSHTRAMNRYPNTHTCLYEHTFNIHYTFKDVFIYVCLHYVYMIYKEAGEHLLTDVHHLECQSLVTLEM